MVRLSPVSGSASRWSYRGSDFRIGSQFTGRETGPERQVYPQELTFPAPPPYGESVPEPDSCTAASHVYGLPTCRGRSRSDCITQLGVRVAKPISDRTLSPCVQWPKRNRRLQSVQKVDRRPSGHIGAVVHALEACPSI